MEKKKYLEPNVKFVVVSGIDVLAVSGGIFFNDSENYFDDVYLD